HDVLTEGFYNRLFAVPKRTGGWRPVLDVSALNKYVILTPFTMESPKSVLASIRRNDWMTSIDLKDAYFQVPVHPASRKYLRFVWRGTVYQFKVLCFGLSSAPQVFTRVFAQVAKWLRLVNIRILLYLDDWLVMSHSRQAVLADTQSVLDLSQVLGVHLNLGKSSLIPTMTSVYLGMVIDSHRFWVSPKEERVVRFLSLLGDFLSCGAPCAKMWQQVLGHMVSLVPFVPYGRLRMRELQHHLHSRWDLVSNPRTTFIAVPEACRLDLLWWAQGSRLRAGVSLALRRPTLALFADASTQGWGATLEGLEASGTWTLAESMLHINVLEIRAISLALSRWQTLVAGRVVSVYSDNTTAVAYIKNQ
ncbi:MAG: reverse transcriptase domain-containing protein, partial [Cyanobacteria bacterium J06553_1]